MNEKGGCEGVERFNALTPLRLSYIYHLLLPRQEHTCPLSFPRRGHLQGPQRVYGTVRTWRYLRVLRGAG